MPRSIFYIYVAVKLSSASASCELTTHLVLELIISWCLYAMVVSFEQMFWQQRTFMQKHVSPKSVVSPQ